MKKIFSRGSSSKSKTVIEPPRSLPVMPDQTAKMSKSTKNETVADDAMSKAERNLYKFDLPANEQGFDDLIKQYQEGSRFQYVALSGKDEETYSARIRRLVTMTPKVGREMLPQHKLPLLKLFEETEQYNLAMAVPKKGKQYIRLSSVVAYYCPLISAFSQFTKVDMSLHDSRLLSETCVQSATFNSNITQKVELSLDYCIPRSSCSKINLNIARQQKFLKEGEEWGAVQLQIKLEESDFPYSSNLKEVTAVMALPPAVLDNHNVNPNHIDTTMIETQRRTVRDMYESGDIADENEPIKESTGKITYAKSSVAAKVKGARTKQSFGSGWEGMQFRKPEIPKDQISQDPSDDGEMTIPDLESQGKVEEYDDELIVHRPGKEEGVESPKEKKLLAASIKARKGVSFNEFDV